ASDVSAMDSGHTYVNVHTTLFPAGEIRAQLFIKQQLLFFKGMLQGSQEVPPNSSAAHGIVILKYDTATNVLELWGDYQNLSAGTTAAHIHQAPPRVSGSVIVSLNFAGDSTGSLTGSGTFTDAQEVDLIAGNMYVNVHSTTYPAGEIRAQLSVATPGQSDLLSGNLEEAQEVPPTGSTAIGSVKALLDKGTDSVFVTGNYFGLSDTPTAAHIHRAPVGVAGPVIVSLNARGSDTGAVSGAGLLVASDVMEMVNGNTYVNVHSSLFPAGEIRGQLGDIVLPVKLLYFNGYKDQNRVTLLWASAQEINFSHYEIEQQNPVSKQWVKKATIAGTNNESGSQYRYSDLPAAYKNDYVFYRLKMVDKDGRFSYSPVIRINYNQVKAELLIHPNPVRNDELQFTITGLSTDRKIYFVIADYNGREGISGLASSLSNNTINVSSLAPGMYKLVVKFDNIILQQSFIK
ncbi:MAG: CHRD domain-containing protein, partial [Parafilimonas sp.]